MAKTEKKSQIKGLTPQLQLNYRDSLNGSYPISNKTVVPTGSIVFNDLSSLRFDSSTNLGYGTGLPTGSIYIQTLGIPTSSLAGTGMLRAGVGDMWLAFSSSASAFVPFRDSQRFAADGKSQGNIFFASGAGLNNIPSPLWSKRAVEIPIPGGTQGNVPMRMLLSGSDGTSFLMRFYDWNSNTWVSRSGVDSANSQETWVSQALSNPQQGLNPYYATKMVGFGPVGINNGSYNQIDYMVNALRPFSQFGFPFDSRYNFSDTDTFSSVGLQMSKFISKPFVVESIVLSFSGSNTSGDFICEWDDLKLLSGYGTNYFFLLCQRGNIAIDETVFRIPSPSSFPTGLTGSLTSSYTGKNCDIITAIPVITPGVSQSEWNNYTGAQNQGNTFWAQQVFNKNPNVNVVFPDSGSAIDVALLKWTGQKILSGVVCSPTEMKPEDSVSGPHLLMRSGTLGQNNIVYSTFSIFRNGTQKNLSTRDYRGAYNGTQLSNFFDAIESIDVMLPVKVWKPNPYILFPEDKLILGAQSSFAGSTFSRQTVNGTNVTGSGTIVGGFNIATSPNSFLTLYGSYLEEDSETVESEQILTTDAVHEVIE